MAWLRAVCSGTGRQLPASVLLPFVVGDGSGRGGGDLVAVSFSLCLSVLVKISRQPVSTSRQALGLQGAEPITWYRVKLLKGFSGRLRFTADGDRPRLRLSPCLCLCRQAGQGRTVQKMRRPFSPLPAPDANRPGILDVLALPRTAMRRGCASPPCLVDFFTTGPSNTRSLGMLTLV